MAWVDTRDALEAVLKGLGYTVFLVPPPQMNIANKIVVMLLPPARSTVRYSGNVKKKVYQQRVTLLHSIGSGNERAVGVAVDAAAEAIDDVMDGQVALGGEAVVVSAPTWEDADLTDYPPGSGKYFVGMSGTIQITTDQVVRHVRSGLLGVSSGDTK